MAFKTKVERRKPIRAWFELKSVRRGVMTTQTGDQIEVRVPEGYSFVNEWVGDGVNLKRSAMIAATTDYMTWGAVREMHQPSAVGTALGRVSVTNDDGTEEELDLGVTWDEKGAWLRTAVVDADAIVKLDAGVYRGYSVGIRATVMRGVDVEQCLWIENSLVDRPADPDARLELIRAAGVDPSADFEVVRYWDEDDNWVEGAYTFATMQNQLAEQDLIDDLYSAWYVLIGSWRSILQADGDASLFGQSLDEFVAYVKSEILTEFSADRAAKLQGVLTRFEAAKGLDPNQVTQQQEAAQADLARVQGQLTATDAKLKTLTTERDAARSELQKAQAEVERLKNLADPRQPIPAKFPLERSFAVNGNEKPDAELAKLREELSTLTRTARHEPDDKKRYEMAVRIGQLKLQIAALETN